MKKILLIENGLTKKLKMSYFQLVFWEKRRLKEFLNTLNSDTIAYPEKRHPSGYRFVIREFE